MKHLVSAVALALSAATPVVASAGSITIDFEKVWDYDNGGVANYYNGGNAADGSAGGPNFGVSFTNISGLSNTTGFAYYANPASPIGVAYAYDTGAVINFVNYANGFRNFSFYYSSFEAVSGAVKAYSGLNGTGVLLGSFDIPVNDTNASGLYDTFTLGSLALASGARSFDLSALAGRNVAFDVVSVVPEPSIVLLMLTGGTLALVRRRQSTR